MNNNQYGLYQSHTIESLYSQVMKEELIEQKETRIRQIPILVILNNQKFPIFAAYYSTNSLT